MIRHLCVVAMLVGVVVLPPGVHAYLKLGTDVNDRVIQLRWPTSPVRYFISSRSVPGVTTSDLQAAVARAFGRWGSVSTAAISGDFVGFTDAQPPATDGLSVLGFRARFDLDRVLGSTTFVVDNVTGELLESDIFLNAAFDWSVAPNGQTARYDVESIAVHEIGHLLGLSHSALGETTLNPDGHRTVLGKRAVMFPIAYPTANIEDRTLEADDIAGLSDIYGTTAARRELGSISGRVLRNGAGLFGAHVTAFNSRTGELTGGFTLTQRGEFVIGGLVPGVYVVRAEPLDDADVESFFGGDVPVEIGFKPAYAPQLVAVPAGGAGGSIEIKVPAK